jgi:membrane fusion protein (multidrug efflux system)
LALVAAGWWGTRALSARKAAAGSAATAGTAASATAGTAAPAASSAGQALELTAGDFTTATTAELSTALAVTGSVKAVQSAMVKARVAGEIRRLTVREGDRVSTGQLLGQIDATEYQWRLRQAEDQVQAAQSQLDLAQKALDNNKALVNQGFISRNALDNSVSSAAGATASLQAARAGAELARKAVADSEIRSPIAGLIAQRLAQPGERVGIDARILEVVDLSRLELEVAVAPEDVVQLRLGQTAQVQVDGLPQALPARLVRINPSAQAGTRSVLAYLELPASAQAAGLRQGLFARGQVELLRKRALVVPASALRYDQAKPYVLAVVDGQATVRPVSVGSAGSVVLGGKSENVLEITAGLDAGSIVLRGTVGTLREGTRLKLPGTGSGAGASAAAR